MKLKHIYFALFIVFLFMPHLAFAQSYNLFSVSDNDVSKKEFLDKLFGPLTGASETSPFGTAVGVFNGAALIVGGIYLAYTYISGTAQGAHDGEFLGKKYSSMWVPIRMLLGTTMAFPSLAGGFCLAQWLVMWLALQGIGFANTVWEAGTRDFASASVTGSVVDTTHAYGITRQLFLNNLCIAMFNKALGEGATGDGSGETQALFGSDFKFEAVGSAARTDGGNSLHYDYLMKDGDEQAQFVLGKMLGTSANSVCGSANFTSRAMASPNSQAGTTTSTESGALYTSGFVNLTSELTQERTDISASVNAINAVHNGQLAQLQAKTKALADAYVLAPTPDIAKKVDAISTGYVTALQAVMKAQVASLQKTGDSFSKNITDDGWMMAGAYYFKMARLQSAISDSINNYPKVQASKAMIDMVKIRVEGTGASGAFTNDFGTDTNKAILAMLVSTRGQYVKAAQQTADARIANSEFAKGDIGLDSTDDSSFGSFIDKLFSSEDLNPESIMGLISDNPDADPITQANQIGTSMVMWAEIVLGVGLVVALVSPTVGIIAVGIASPLIVMGAILTTVIPMMPFLIWVGSVFSWALLLVEAMVAAPLWAVQHLNPHGDGMTGKAGLGYKIVLALTLKPVLMVYGLLSSMIIFKIFAHFVSVAYGVAFAQTTSGNAGLLRLVSLLAGFGIYVALMWLVTQKTFAIIHILPERISRWMDAASSGADEGGNFGAGTLVGGIAGVKAMNSGLAPVAKGLGKAGDRIKDVISSKKDNKDSPDGEGGGGGGQPGGSGGGSSSAMNFQQSQEEGSSGSVPLSKSGSSGGSSSSSSGSPSGSGGSGSGSSGQSLSEMKDTARMHAKKASSYMNQALDQSPELSEQFQSAKKADYQASKIGQPANQMSRLMSSHIKQANEARANGQPLQDFQKSLLKSASARSKGKALQKEIGKLEQQE